MKNIEKIKRHLDLAEEVHQSPVSKNDLTFMARPFVQATLPHRDPGNIAVWQRRNGRLTLKLQPGFEDDPETGEPRCMGFPYGTIPRLLLFWMTSEVIRTNCKTLEFGDNLSSFLHEIGVDSSTGGKNGSIIRFKEQLKRLIFSTFTVDEKILKENGHHRMNFINISVASRGSIEWIPNLKSNIELSLNTSDKKNGSWIELTENFYKTLTHSVVPLDMRIIHEIKQSPLALDLYAWLVHRTYENNENQILKKESFVTWKMLHDQFGSSYADVKNFKKKFKPIFRQILSLTRNFRAEEASGGIKIKPRLFIVSN